MKKGHTILVVDDDPVFRKTLTGILRAKGYRTVEVAQARAALEACRKYMPVVALLDLALNEESGLDLMRDLKMRYPLLECIVLTGQSSQASAIDAVNLGVFGYLLKPFDMERLLVTIQRAIEKTCAEDAIRRSQERFRVLAEYAPFGISIMRDDKTFDYLNPAFTRIFGYTIGDVPDRQTWFQKAYGDEEYRKLVPMIWDADLSDAPGPGAAMERTFNVRCKDGLEKTIHVRDVPVKDGNQYLVYEDISARISAESALRRSEENYRALVEGSFDGIFVRQGREIIFANTRLHEMLGYGQGELLGMDYSKIYHPEYQDLIARRSAAHLRAEEIPYQFEVKLLRKNGTWFLGEVSSRATRLDPEPVVQIWVRDISERKRAEESLRDSENRYRTFFETSKDCVFITSRDGRWIDSNQAAVEMFGYETKEELLNTDVSDLYAKPDDREKYIEMMQRRGQTIDYPLNLRKKDGCILNVLHTSVARRDEGGNVIGYQGTIRDITEERSLEAQLQHAQKMEAVGRLAGGVAHDFNNLLQAILGYAQIYLLRHGGEDQDCEEIREVERAANRGTELSKRLLAFSRKVQSKLRPVDLNQEISEASRLLNTTLSKTIDIELRLSDDLRIVSADSGQIVQVLMNLGINARDSMPEGGTLIIQTENASLSEAYCARNAELTAGEYVILSVSDTGCGMDKKTQEHIFEPFYTTKKTGMGTGLGLSIVYGIVKNHGGHIDCESKPGIGTTFRIYLPAVKRAETREEDVRLEGLTGGTETILLVDDEESLRNLGKQMLERFGYRVVTAPDGERALEIMDGLQNLYSPPDLVIMDLIMPGMGGKRCLEEVLRINPETKVVIATGHSPEEPLEGLIEGGVRAVIRKPYDVRQILGVLRNILNKD